MANLWTRKSTAALADETGFDKEALALKAAMFRAMGMAVNVCGTDHGLPTR